MVAHGMVGAAELHALNRLLGVLVLRPHEPSRLECAYGKRGKTEPAVLCGGCPIVDAVMKTGIADMVDGAGFRLDHESTPERHSPVVHSPRRPMMCGLAMD